MRIISGTEQHKIMLVRMENARENAGPVARKIRDQLVRKQGIVTGENCRAMKVGGGMRIRSTRVWFGEVVRGFGRVDAEQRREWLKALQVPHEFGHGWSAVSFCVFSFICAKLSVSENVNLELLEMLSKRLCIYIVRLAS